MNPTELTQIREIVREEIRQALLDLLDQVERVLEEKREAKLKALAEFLCPSYPTQPLGEQLVLGDWAEDPKP